MTNKLPNDYIIIISIIVQCHYVRVRIGLNGGSGKKPPMLAGRRHHQYAIFFLLASSIQWI